MLAPRLAVLALACTSAVLAAQQPGAPPLATQQPASDQQPAARQPAATQPAGQPPAAPATSQPLTFRVEVNYVEIDATVVDAQGNPVRDLTREDFQVVEEGRPQALTVFAPVEIPVERPDPPLFRASAIEPDVQTNRRAFDGRVFVLILDDLHTHFTRTPRVRAAARQFIERLGANDMAAVVTTGGTRQAAQEFTSSRARLLRAVDEFSGRKLDPPGLERLREAVAGRSMADPNEAERAHKARSMLTSIRNIAEYLTNLRGRRKSVVLFSEGIDYDITNPFENRSATDITTELRAAVASATRGNVSFYAVDPRGLGGFEDLIDMPAPPADKPGMGMSTLLADLRAAQDSLRVIAEETGGIAAINRNDYRDAFDRIIRDNSSYYVLGYYSDNTRRDGRFRTVNVRVTRPGLTVRARKGYTAPRGNLPAARAAATDASPELREALASPVPVSGLPFTASAVPFRGASRQASVLLIVEIDGSKFRFAEQDGKLTNEIEVVFVPYDNGGKARGAVRDVATISPRPATRDTILARGVRLVRRVDLPAGRYSLRVGVREAGSGASGTVTLDLDVPDFGKAPLAMSGIALASTGSMNVPTPRPDEQLKDILPGPPTVTRSFPRSDTLSIFTEVYDAVRTAHKLEITTTLTADDGRVGYSHVDTRGSDELGARGDGFGHLRTIPLDGLAPGRYVLRVAARGLTSDSPSATRELELTIR